MPRKFFAGLLPALAAFSVAASGQAQADPFDPQKVQQNLLAGVGEALNSGFDMVDANRDGFVSKAELREFAKARGLAPHGVMSGRSFDRADRDRDGLVSRQEFVNSALTAYRQSAGL